MRATMMEEPLLIHRFLERAGRLFPEVEVVSRRPDGGLHRYRYREFFARAHRLAAALVDGGLDKGDRVATLLWNHHVHLEAYFGVPIRGGVVHTLNPRLAAEELAYIADHARDRVLIVDEVLLSVLEGFRERAPFSRILVANRQDRALPGWAECYEEVLSRAPREVSYSPAGEGDPVGMCYTSGTTGHPKGVVYSHRSTVLHALASALPDSVGLSHRDTVMPVVPMFHVNAWGLPYAAVMVGAKLVFPGPRLDALSLLELLEGERVTVAAGVPTVWLRVLEALDREPGRWRLHPELRLIVGGSAAPEAMIRGFDRHGVTVIHAWGMTEMSPLGTLCRLKREHQSADEDTRYRYRAMQGLPMPVVDMRIVDEKGEVDWDGRSMGELQVRGPCVARAYYNRPDAADAFTEDGWFRTGDVAVITPEGYMKIADRTKDLVKSGGEWISSVDLENALMGHPQVAEAAVVAVPHPEWEERPLAVVVPRDPPPRVAELRAHLAARFPKWWLPDAILFVEEIPKSSTGKFLKRALRERFGRASWEELKAREQQQERRAEAG